MTQNHLGPSLAIRVYRHTCARKWVALCRLLFLAFMVASLSARADEQEDQYLRIVETIQRADALVTKGQNAAALTKYNEAQASLEGFARTNSDWNPKMVRYRLKYLGDKIEACSEKPAATPESRGTAEPGSATAATGERQVKLLDAGSEPRKALRLHPTAGDKQSLTMKIKMAMEMKIAGMENPAIKLPAMVMAMDVTVQDVSSEGDIKYEMVMTDASVDSEPGVMPQVVDAMKKSFANLKGLSGTGTVTSQGVNKATDIRMPAGADPQVQQAMDQMKQSFAALSMPLPNDAVGPGAKWESTTPVKSQGMTFEQTTRFELVSIDGEQIVAKTIITQTASNQKIQSPAMPGLKLDLTKMIGNGTGELTLDLNHLLPHKANADSHTELTMGMNLGAQKQSMSMNMDMSMQVESK